MYSLMENGLLTAQYQEKWVLGKYELNLVCIQSMDSLFFTEITSTKLKHYTTCTKLKSPTKR